MIANNSAQKFELGQIVATPGAIEAMNRAGQNAREFLARHVQGDWGDVCPDDATANNQSLIDGSRLLSVYRTNKGAKLWILTEAAADENGNRAATTLLLPEEY
jgi:hypothetical protein